MRIAVSCLFLCVALNASGDVPALSASDIVNAADHSGGKVAPGEIVVLFPAHVGPAVLAGARLGADGRVTTSLGETRVLFDGIAAPMAYSVSGEVSAVVPYTVAKKKTTQVEVEYQGVRTPPVTLPVVDSAPALYTLDLAGKGQAAMLNETGCCNSPRNPAMRGSIGALYATGAGRTVPPSVDGSVAAYTKITGYPVPRLPVRVTVGGKPAEILYAAAAPHAVAGLLQVNFRVPANAPLGDAVPLVLSVGNFHSQDGVTMAVRSAKQRVLVLDEESTRRDWLGKVLAGSGYDVLKASNDGEALEQTVARPMDLIITDLAGQRPETIRTLRATAPQLKIIATVATLGVENLRAADLLGAQAVISRSMGPASVVRRVRELLRSRPVPYVVSEPAPPVLSRRGIVR